MQTSAHSAGIDLPLDLTLLGSFWDVILDIQQTVNGGEPESLGEARARLSAVRNAIRHRLPGTEDSRPPSLLLPGGDDDPLAVMSRRLAAGELFTAVAGDYAGEPVSARVVRDGRSLMNSSERDQTRAGLDGSGARPVLRRRGELRTGRGSKLIANVTSLVIPARVRQVPGDPGRAEAALEALAGTDVPLGQVLEPLGLRREPLWLWPYCSDDTVLNAGARLWLPGPVPGTEWPAGLTAEQVRRLDWWAAP